ncbi:MAG TPA: hypothetical protein PKZ32_00210 [Candidatus Melainabacteria bacterium]|nr:hypothetical protein [Candidatus Melainabacteria bacterium]
MTGSERRNTMTLEDISAYWRHLRSTGDLPNLHRVLESIKTIDTAFAGAASVLSHHLSADAWCHLRDDLYNLLIASFPGYFLIYEEGNEIPMDSAAPWPNSGIVEFYPEQANRRSDVYRAELRRLHPAIALSLRWCLADNRSTTKPEDFESFFSQIKTYESEDEEEEARRLLDRLFALCEDEAIKSKKIAHRRWWQISSEANITNDKRLKNELKRQLSELQMVWGAPS